MIGKCALLLMAWLTAPLALAAATEPRVIRQAENLTWMTEEYPPFNFVDANRHLRGISVDILMEMFKRLEIQVAPRQIGVYPWARSYKKLLTEPGTGLFSMNYTKRRQQLFKFVGPIVPVRVSVISLKSRKLAIDGLAGLRQLTYAVVREDIGEQLLNDLGIAPVQIVPLHSAESMLRFLLMGRVDAIAYAEDVAHYQFAEVGVPQRQYEVLHVLQDSHIGYAFHRDTPDSLIEVLNNSLRQLHQEGVVEAIRQRYVGGGADDAP